MLDVIKKLNFLLTKRDKQFLIGLVFFSIFIAMVETVGVSAIMPFIAVASDFSLIESNEYYKYFYEGLGFNSYINYVIVFGFILILFYIFRALVNITYYHLLARFSQSRYHTLAYKLYENYLGMPYDKFTNKNTSFLTKSIVTEASGAITLIRNIILIIGEVFVIIFVYFMLIFANWKVTLLVTIVLTVKVVFLTKTISIKMKKEGDIRAKTQKSLYEVINSTFGNFKLIKLLSNEEELRGKFKDASFGYAKSQIRAQTLNAIPRIFLEVVGFSLIVSIVIYFLYKYNQDISVIIPLLSIYVLALYRLMPSTNRIISAYNLVLFHKKALEIVHNDLIYETEDLGDEKIEFQNRIEVNNLLFSYKNQKIIDNTSLTINKGERVALVGESGSGKSTFIDLMIGLYKPESGEILIDGFVLSNKNLKCWRDKIGYIPQNIYLFDGTVSENVAFSKGVDKNRLETVLKQARIWDFLKTKDGVETQVGEGGIQLSGGQKQRIAIARALYTDPEILILDEATSALDSETEEEIMKEMYSLSKELTLIIIAHRLTTLIGCDKVFEIEKGKLEKVDLKS